MSNLMVTGTVTGYTPPKGKGPASFFINNEPKEYRAWPDALVPGFGPGAQVSFQAYVKEWAGQEQWNVSSDFETKQTTMKILSPGSAPPVPSASGAGITTQQQVPVAHHATDKEDHIQASVALKAAVDFVNQQMIVEGVKRSASDVGLVFAYFKSLLSGKTEVAPIPENIPGEPFNDSPMDSTVQQPVAFT